MTVKQLSIFLENKNGTLIKVLDTLSKANIQIIASTVADTKDYGIYRVLCNNPVQAYMLLKDEGINVQLTDVFAISIDDTPGTAANAINNGLQSLADWLISQPKEGDVTAEAEKYLRANAKKI